MSSTPPSASDDRDETPNQKADRNWNELLQELRVTQTGVQVLTGFLLTVPFQARFPDLDRFDVVTYLVVLLLAMTSTGLLMAPVSLHRALFGLQRKQVTVAVAHRLAQAGLAVLGLALAGATLLVFSVVLGRTAAGVAGGAVLLGLLVLWVALPASARARRQHDGA